MNNKPALLRYRFLAFILDGAILNIPSFFLLAYIGTSTSLAQLGYRLMIYIVIFTLPVIWWVLFYDVYCTTRFGGTPGKLITGLRITDMEGYNLSVKKSLFRYTIGYAFSFLLFAAGFWAIIKDPLKQGWHDKATGSKVIMVANRWLPSLILIILFYSLHAFLLVTAITNAFTGPLKTEVLQILQENRTKQTIQKKAIQLDPKKPLYLKNLEQMQQKIGSGA